MRLVCKTASYREDKKGVVIEKLTKGRSYQTVECLDYMGRPITYVVKDDTGSYNYYLSCDFYTLQEHRDIVLNDMKIGDNEI